MLVKREHTNSSPNMIGKRILSKKRFVGKAGSSRHKQSQVSIQSPQQLVNQSINISSTNLLEYDTGKSSKRRCKNNVSQINPFQAMQIGIAKRHLDLESMYGSDAISRDALPKSSRIRDEVFMRK